MKLKHPLRTGTALSITVGIGYAVCALIFWLWPSAAAAFTNALFHGLDFGKLQTGPTPFDFTGFVYALLVLMVWALILGTLFAWLRIELAGHAAAAQTDPVCGMHVEPRRAAGKYEYQGRSYFFCSTRCLGTFRSNPEKFVGHGPEDHPARHAGA